MFKWLKKLFDDKEEDPLLQFIRLYRLSKGGIHSEEVELDMLEYLQKKHHREPKSRDDQLKDLILVIRNELHFNQKLFRAYNGTKLNMDKISGKMEILRTLLWYVENNKFKDGE